VEISTASSPRESGIRYARSVSDVDNILADFPAEAFTVLVFCDVCGHQAHVAHSNVQDGTPARDFPLLRCSVCGIHGEPLRIAYSRGRGSPTNYSLSPQSAA
jgi:hypothetical protein